jgi:hypothetical protein
MLRTFVIDVTLYVPLIFYPSTVLKSDLCEYLLHYFQRYIVSCTLLRDKIVHICIHRGRCRFCCYIACFRSNESQTGYGEIAPLLLELVKWSLLVAGPVVRSVTFRPQYAFGICVYLVNFHTCIL